MPLHCAALTHSGSARYLTPFSPTYWVRSIVEEPTPRSKSSLKITFGAEPLVDSTSSAAGRTAPARGRGTSACASAAVNDSPVVMVAATANNADHRFQAPAPCGDDIGLLQVFVRACARTGLADDRWMVHATFYIPYSTVQLLPGGQRGQGPAEQNYGSGRRRARVPVAGPAPARARAPARGTGLRRRRLPQPEPEPEPRGRPSPPIRPQPAWPSPACSSPGSRSPRSCS
jgi:hypothetical protein